MNKLTYQEFTAISALEKNFNTQIISFKHNPVKTIDYNFNKILGSTESIKELKSTSENIKAWSVKYKLERPSYIIILADHRVIVTDETQVDITDKDSVIKEN